MFLIYLLVALVLGTILVLAIIDIVKYRRLTKRDELSTYTKVVSSHVMDAGDGL